MIENKFYTYIKRKFDAKGKVEYYEIYYRLQLSAGWLTDQWDSSNGISTISNGVYVVDLPEKAPKRHTLSLEVSQRSGDDNIALDGVIRVTGIPGKPKKWDQISVHLEIKGGPVTGNGAAVHIGDAD